MGVRSAEKETGVWSTHLPFCWRHSKLPWSGLADMLNLNCAPLWKAIFCNTDSRKRLAIRANRGPHTSATDNVQDGGRTRGRGQHTRAPTDQEIPAPGGGDAAQTNVARVKSRSQAGRRLRPSRSPDSEQTPAATAPHASWDEGEGNRSHHAARVRRPVTENSVRVGRVRLGRIEASALTSCPVQLPGPDAIGRKRKC